MDNTMSQPMFIKIANGPVVEFINIAYVMRILIAHEVNEEQQVTGKQTGVLYLKDGTERALGMNEADWIMRMMPDLIGAPATGTRPPNAR